MTRARPMVLPLIIAFSLACRPNAEHQRVDFERMRRQQRYSPYQDAPMFRDGMAMRTPPAQTLSREEFSVGQEVARGRHGNTALASVPIAVTPDLLAAGRREFGVYCAVCHSVEGVGGSASVVGRNMKPPPPSLLGDSARAVARQTIRADHDRSRSHAGVRLGDSIRRSLGGRRVPAFAARCEAMTELRFAHDQSFVR